MASGRGAEFLARDLHGAVVVAVAVVGMVEMPLDDVVCVAAVRNRLVSAAGAVGVVGAMLGLVVVVSVGVRAADFDGVLLDGSIVFLVVEVAVVEIVRVSVVLDGGMLAAGAVDVVVSGVYFGHALSFRSISLLVRVGEDREDHIVYVAVGERVIHVLAFPPPDDETFATQDFQPL